MSQCKGSKDLVCVVQIYVFYLEPAVPTAWYSFLRLGTEQILKNILVWFFNA